MRTSHAESSNPLSRNPLFAAAAAFAFGVFLHRGLQIDLRLLVFCLIILLAVSFLHEQLITIVVVAGFVLTGAFVSKLAHEGISDTSLSALYDRGWVVSGDPVRFEGTLLDHPQLSVGGVFLSVTVNKITYKKELIVTSGNVRAFLVTDSPASERCFNELSLKAGNSVRIAARLKREEGFLNPGTVTVIDSLDRRGIDANASIKSCYLIEKTGDGVSAFSRLYELREWLAKRVIATHDRRTAGIVLASVLGNKNFLTKDSGDTFRENGTFHVLIISGLHITLIGGLILLGVRRLTANRRVQFLVSNTMLWLFAAVVGLQLPVFRAALMYSIFSLGYAVFRETQALNSLGASALVILVWRPADLFNPSFQLTFLSILAIVGFALPVIARLRETGSWVPARQRPFPPRCGRALKIFTESLYWSEKRLKAHLSKQTWDGGIEKTSAGKFFADRWIQIWMRRVFELGFVSFSVQLFLLPLLIINFHRVGAASFVSNLFAGGAVVAQAVFSCATVAISLMNLEASQAFFSVTSFPIDVSLYLQNLISNVFLRSVRIPVYSGLLAGIYPLYYLPLTGLLFSVSLWKPFEAGLRSGILKLLTQFSIFAAILLSALMIFHPYSSPIPDGRLTVDFLDVGQGDSALITFPDGRTLLIDGGGQRDLEEGDSVKRDIAGIGERVVSEFLWERGYSSIDYILSTHPDADHINGLTDVLKNFDVKDVFAGGDFTGVREFDLLKSAAMNHNVPLKILTDGSVMKFGDVVATILNPSRQREAKPDNDDSVVVRLEFGKRTFLFTGDIGSFTEHRINEDGMPITADVVKVAHHGSRTSSSNEFVKKTKAKYAVIPVGRNSPYGHPHSEVVDRWTKNGSKVLIVGERGMITISTNGKDLEIRGFLDP